MLPQQNAQSAQPKNILVRGTNWLGDAVMTTPALRRLRMAFPAARITLLATPRTTGLFTGSNLVDSVLIYHRQEEGVQAFWQMTRVLRAHQFNLALLFQNAFEAALLAKFGQIPLRLGYAAQGRSFLLTHRLKRDPQHRNRHQVHDYLDLVLLAEQVCLAPPTIPLTPLDFLPKLNASIDQMQEAEMLLRQQGVEVQHPHSKPLIALNAGATNSHAKCWPEERFAALADLFTTRLQAQIVFIGAPSERENAARVLARMQTPAALNLAGETTMQQLVGLLARCDLLVSNDTGPAHIAAALGRPTLTLFGPTNEFETAPTGERAALLRVDGIECARCMHRVCPIDHRCMTRLEVTAVAERALQLLQV
jgi:heptosyltransferase II